jgi:hypothetical protein
MPNEKQALAAASKPGEIVVISLLKAATCSECGLELEPGDFLRVENDQPLCTDCADLGALVFLPSGDTALTRRSRKYSKLSAVVLQFSRSRKRYERRGTLVEPAALDQAEEECEADADVRAQKRAAAAVTRAAADQRYMAEFTQAIRAQYPSCPPAEAETIARHACEKYSGRVGRTAMAKELDRKAVTLAVRAHIRHEHTDYDHLLSTGVPRAVARERIADRVDRREAEWSRPAP